MKSESAISVLVRLEASRLGIKLWRNNVGVLFDAKGRPVRYGLANDSKQLNAVLKSSDLVGWRSVLIEQKHVGTVIGQCVLRETKREGWHYVGNAHEKAQAAWLQLAADDGCDVGFVTGEGSF